MFKRVALFVATNLAVLALLSVVMSVLGVNPGQFGGLLVMAALFGFGGAFVSLWMSKWIAKRSTDITTLSNASTARLVATNNATRLNMPDRSIRAARWRGFLSGSVASHA